MCTALYSSFLEKDGGETRMRIARIRSRTKKKNEKRAKKKQCKKKPNDFHRFDNVAALLGTTPLKLSQTSAGQGGCRNLETGQDARISVHQ
jgi:hypothetical protein